MIDTLKILKNILLRTCLPNFLGTGPPCQILGLMPGCVSWVYLAIVAKFLELASILWVGAFFLFFFFKYKNVCDCVRNILPTEIFYKLVYRKFRTNHI
jgi:hypothetical protein